MGLNSSSWLVHNSHGISLTNASISNLDIFPHYYFKDQNNSQFDLMSGSKEIRMLGVDETRAIVHPITSLSSALALMSSSYSSVVLSLSLLSIISQIVISIALYVWDFKLEIIWTYLLMVLSCHVIVGKQKCMCQLGSRVGSV